MRFAILKFGYTLLFFFHSVLLLAQSQHISVQGKVTDETGKPLESASVVVELADADESLIFGKTDEHGVFIVSMPKHSSATFRISFLGYAKQTKEVQAQDSDLHLSFQLTAAIPIEEVVINYNYNPITIKKDTIVFDATAFTDASDKKLQDILKKLPGVSVRDGKVLFQGQAITTTKVENRSFFGGNTRLAVENIPSDAVRRIEMISHFSEIDFMKDIIASDEIAMNVELKESHKNLLFGDLEAAAGTNKAVNIHTALFSFTKERSFQIIGDLNTTGKSLFSLSDYMQLQGGTNSFLGIRNIGTQGILGLTDINRNHRQINQQLVAGNFQRNWKNKLDLTVFGIFSRVQSKDFMSSNLQYLLLEDQPLEYRTTEVEPTTLMTWLNVRMDYKPSDFEVFNYRMGLQAGRQENAMNYTSQWGDIHARSSIGQENDILNFQNLLAWTKKISPRKIFQGNVSLLLKKDPSQRSLDIADFQFQELLPLSPTENYVFWQNKREQIVRSVLDLQYHYTINRFHQLSPLLQVEWTSSRLDDQYTQWTVAENWEDLLDNGFGNDLTFKQFNISTGLHYKLSIGKMTGKATAAFRYIKQDLAQNSSAVGMKSLIFTPKLAVDYAFNKATNFELGFQGGFDYPTLRFINDSYELVSFNTLTRGIPKLTLERYQTYSANFRKYELKSYNMWGYLYYTKKESAYRSQAIMESTNQILQTLIMETPESNLSANLRFERTYGYFSPYVGLSTTAATYQQVINDQYVKTKHNGGSGKVGFRTFAQKLPTLDLSYEKSIHQFKGATNSEFKSDKIQVDAQYAFPKLFSLKGGYHYFKNRNAQLGTAAVYDILHLVIDYQPEKKPWALTLEGQNILNRKNSISTSQSNYLFTEQQIHTLPQQILVGFRYKL